MFLQLMKKQILLFCAVFASAVSMAQLTPSAGIKAGVTMATIKGEATNSLQSILDFSDGMINTGNSTGFFAGGYVSIPFNDKFSVEPGIYYTQKGYSLRGELALKGAEFLGANASAKLASHYIDVPVVLKANLNGFQIFAGPQVSYLAKANLHTKAGVLGFNLYNQKMDASDQLNQWDFAVTGGIGYGFANGLNLTAAYDHGLSKADAGKNFEAYNRSFKIGIGFSF